MSDRERYSKAREDALWRLVDKEITDFRIFVLRNGLSGLSENKQEQLVFQHLNGLAEKVTKKYREYLKVSK